MAIPIPAQVVDEHLWECFATLDLGNIPALADDVVLVVRVGSKHEQMCGCGNA